jgi:hypothetical protein
MAFRALFQMVRAQTPMLGEQRSAAKDWYVFFYTLYNAVTQGLPQAEAAITLTVSPFAYQALIRGQLLIAGGTVSAIEFSRNRTTFYNAGITAGFVQMDAGDQVRVTYTVAPTLTFVPM